MVPEETSTALLRVQSPVSSGFQWSPARLFQRPSQHPLPNGRELQEVDLFRGNTKNVCMLPVLLRCTPSAKNTGTACMEALVLPKFPIIGVVLRERGDAQGMSERSHRLCAKIWASSHCSSCNCSTSDSRTLPFASRWRPNLILVGEGFLQSQFIQCPLCHCHPHVTLLGHPRFVCSHWGQKDQTAPAL